MFFLQWIRAYRKFAKLSKFKFRDLEPLQEIENQEKINKKESSNTQNFNNDDDSSKKKENDNEIINNSREKKEITVELSKDEKIVYSHLGINPLIKLGKQYITNNHLIRLEDSDNKEKESTSENTKKSINKISSKKTNKKASTSNSIEKFEVVVDESKEVNPENKLPKKTTAREEIETSDEMDNPRRKRRRSSASIE